jgi:hypothetical protein
LTNRVAFCGSSYLDPALPLSSNPTNLPFEAEHGLDDAWGHVHEIDSSFDDVFRLHKSRRIRNNPVTLAACGTPLSQTVFVIRL